MLGTMGVAWHSESANTYVQIRIERLQASLAGKWFIWAPPQEWWLNKEMTLPEDSPNELGIFWML